MSAEIRKTAIEPSAQGRGGRWWALAALVISGLVVGLDTTVLITALPTLSSKLGAATSDLQWIVAAYTLTLGGLLLPAGVLGDRYGRKRMLMVGLALFGISSVIASQATTAVELIAMRAVMGIGAAFIVPLSLSILPSMFTPEERPRAVSATAAGAFLGLPLGPLLAGFLLTHYAWGSVFLINAPVVVIALLGVWFLVPEGKDPNPRSFDWIGGLLAVAGVTALVYGVIEEPIHGWTDPRVLVGIIAGAVILTAFVVWDLRHPSPFVDLSNFRSRGFTWATMAFVVTGFSLFGVMFILTPFLQIVLGNDAQATGIKLLPLIGGVILGAGAGNVLAARLGHTSRRIGWTRHYRCRFGGFLPDRGGNGLRSGRGRAGRHRPRHRDSASDNAEHHPRYPAAQTNGRGLGPDPGTATDRRHSRCRDPWKHLEQFVPGADRAARRRLAVRGPGRQRWAALPALTRWPPICPRRSAPRWWALRIRPTLTGCLR